MKKEQYKFWVQGRKFGNAKVKNIRAFSYEEAVKKLSETMTNFDLTHTVLVKPFHRVVRDFDFNYEGEFYKNYINQKFEKS